MKVAHGVLISCAAAREPVRRMFANVQTPSISQGIAGAGWDARGGTRGVVGGSMQDRPVGDRPRNMKDAAYSPVGLSTNTAGMPKVSSTCLASALGPRVSVA